MQVLQSSDLKIFQGIAREFSRLKFVLIDNSITKERDFIDNVERSLIGGKGGSGFKDYRLQACSRLVERKLR